MLTCEIRRAAFLRDMDKSSDTATSTSGEILYYVKWCDVDMMCDIM